MVGVGVRSLASVALFCVLLAGCDGNISAPSTVPVSGRVLFKGKPLAGVRVKMHPLFNIGSVKFIPSGETDRDGKFVITTAAPNDGAPAGEYSVTFERPVVGTDKTGLEIETDAWNGKYADPGPGRWKVTVVSGKGELPDFNFE